MVDVREGFEPRKGRRPKWWMTAGKGVVAGVVLLLALLWLSAGTAASLFPARTQRVYVVFKSVSGLKKGEKVQVAGLTKGKVTDLGITNVVVDAKGLVKLDDETMKELLGHTQLEEKGVVVEITRMTLDTQPREEAKKMDWVWSLDVLIQKGGQPTPVQTKGTVKLNRLPEDLRKRLVASFEETELTPVNIAVTEDDFDTVFSDFKRTWKEKESDEVVRTPEEEKFDEVVRSPEEENFDEVVDRKSLRMFSVRVRMPQQMVLCTLELDEDVPIGRQQQDPKKRPPYQITVRHTTPFIGTPFVAMERKSEGEGKPLVFPQTEEERRNLRKRPLNLGTVEADFGGLADSFKKALPKFEDAFSDLRSALERLESVASKIDKGEGAFSVLVNDPKFREDLKGAMVDLRNVARKIDAGDGSLALFLNKPDLHNELMDATKRLDEVLAKIQTSGGTLQKLIDDPKLYDEAVAASTQAKDLLEKANQGNGLVARAFNDSKLGEDFSNAIHEISSVSSEMHSGTGLLAALLNDQGLKQDFQVFITESKEMMGDAKEVMTKIRGGETALGKLAVDPKLGKKVEEAIGSAAQTFGGIARTRTFLGVTSKYWGITEQWVNKGYIRVAPRESMFVQLGGVAISTSEGSPIDSDEDDEGETIFKPDIQLGYKFFDNHLTLRVGLIEGEAGGGVDYEFTVPGWEHDFMVSMEARGGHDEDDGIDEGEDVVIRGEISTQIWKYIRVYAGAGNSVDGMDFMGGITFEWNDDDLKSFIGLLGSAR